MFVLYMIFLKAVQGAIGRINMHIFIGVNFVPLNPGAKIAVRNFIFCFACPYTGAAADAAGNVNNETPVKFTEVVCRLREADSSVDLPKAASVIEPTQTPAAL